MKPHVTNERNSVPEISISSFFASLSSSALLLLVSLLLLQIRFQLSKPRNPIQRVPSRKFVRQARKLEFPKSELGNRRNKIGLKLDAAFNETHQYFTSYTHTRNSNSNSPSISITQLHYPENRRKKSKVGTHTNPFPTSIAKSVNAELHGTPHCRPQLSNLTNPPLPQPSSAPIHVSPTWTCRTPAR